MDSSVSRRTIAGANLEKTWPTNSGVGCHCPTALRQRLCARCRALAKIPRQQTGAGAASRVVAEGLHEDRLRISHAAGIASRFGCHSGRSQATAAALESSAAPDPTVRTPTHRRSAAAGRRHASGLPSGAQPTAAGTHPGSVALAERPYKNCMGGSAKQCAGQSFAAAVP